MDKEYAQKLLEQTKQDYNLISQRFSSTRQFFWKDLKSFLDYTHNGDKVLDAGCGNGRLYDALKTKKIEYHGTDPSEKLIEIAKEKFPGIDFKVADILKMPFPDNYFDKVYSIAVLHHIPSSELRLKAMEELKRILKPKGLLILTVWNLWQKRTIWKSIIKNNLARLVGSEKMDFNDMLVPWKDQSGKIITQRYYHLFSQRELKKLSIKAGFKLKKVGLTERPEYKDNNIYLVAEK